jgi:hypothetical protein
MAKPPKEMKAASRRNGVRDVGSLLPDVGGVAFRRFGFVQGALLGRWREVVGPVYARWSVPESIRFPRGLKSDGVLTIRVEGPFSLQLQHVAPQIIERVNRILGHNAVARVKLVQGEVPKPDLRPVVMQPAAVAPVGNLVGVKDAGLRSALEDLAAQIAVATGPPKIS